MMKLLVIVVFFALACVLVNGQQTLPFLSNTLGSNMVLQQYPYESVIWGWTSEAGATVTVAFDGETHETTSDSDLYWEYTLPTMKASFTAYTIEVTSSDGLSASIDNVLFGEVFFCSGQSNMQFTVDMAFNATAEVEYANQFPNIRVFTVGQGTESSETLQSLNTITQYWTPASNASIGLGEWAAFSAVCWFTGRNLYQALNVPIGLISTNWGGTPVQAWTSPENLGACPHADPSPGCGTSSLQNCNSTLYNAMIAPFLPMRSRGSLWYQAEENAAEPSYYACGFPNMINDWREQFDATPEEFGFFFVQLAPWTSGGGQQIGDTRIAQLAATQLENVGFATAVDLGDIGSPEGNIHPRDKQTVGIRLANTILAMLYGDEDVEYIYPMFTGYEVLAGAPNVVVECAFNSTGSGLFYNDSVSCPNGAQSSCGTFQVMGNDGNWYTADGTLSGPSTAVINATLPDGVEFYGVSYGVVAWPVMPLYNQDNGLPVLPFDTTFEW